GPNDPSPTSSTEFRSPRPVYGSDRLVDRPPSSSMAFTVMGGADRSGEWVVPKTYVAGAVMGGIDLDLREGRFIEQEATSWVGAAMGAIAIIVPHDVRVRVPGLPFMRGFGGVGQSPSVVGPGEPVVRVRGLAVMGGVGVAYRSRKHQGE